MRLSQIGRKDKRLEAEIAKRASAREAMMEQLKKRDLEYKRLFGVGATVVRRGDVTVETRGRAPIGYAGRACRRG